MAEVRSLSEVANEFTKSMLNTVLFVGKANAVEAEAAAEVAGAAPPGTSSEAVSGVPGPRSRRRRSFFSFLSFLVCLALVGVRPRPDDERLLEFEVDPARPIAAAEQGGRRSPNTE
jgi:hypothetical protein